MASKRARSGSSSLTGGTGDVNPQWMVMRVDHTSTGVTAFTVESSVATPIPRVPSSNGRAIVMEILKVQFEMRPIAQISASSNVNQKSSIALSHAANSALSNSTFNLNTSDPRIIATATFYSQQRNTLIATNDEEWLLSVQPVVIDTSDGAGHGILHASDNIFLTMGTEHAFATTYTGRARILYRFKDIGVTEFIGIVQSQNASRTITGS